MFLLTDWFLFCKNLLIYTRNVYLIHVEALHDGDAAIQQACDVRTKLVTEIQQLLTPVLLQS